MKKTIILNTRDSTKNYLKRVVLPHKKEENTYVLRSSLLYMRSGEPKGGSKFIDPSGGPMIIEGGRLEEANAIVKSIDFVENVGWIITF